MITGVCGLLFVLARIVYGSGVGGSERSGHLCSRSRQVAAGGNVAATNEGVP